MYPGEIAGMAMKKKISKTLMKVLVTEMPNNPSDCLFASYDAEYNVVECILSYNGGAECEDCSKCPYLETLNKEKKES